MYRKLKGGKKNARNFRKNSKYRLYSSIDNSRHQSTERR